MTRLFLLAIATFAVLSAQPESKPIRVTFGEPSVWSLDQAHYLLEQQFQRNHSLEATRPGPDDLNANAVNGSKLSAIRTMIQAGTGFDQNVGRNNELALGRMSQDASLRSTRLDQLNASFAEQARIASEMDAVAKDPANHYTKPDGTKDMLPDAKARTAAMTAALDTEKRRGELIKASLTDSVPTQLQKADQPEKVSLNQLGLDMMKDKFAFGDPKLASSNAVDNYVNLQNEMIMKQVTLLRNESGYNRRIVFAELPHSFDVEGLRWYRQASENKLVRVEWKLEGFLYVDTKMQEKLRSSGRTILDEPFKRRELIDVTVKRAKTVIPGLTAKYSQFLSPAATTMQPDQPAELDQDVPVLDTTCFGIVAEAISEDVSQNLTAECTDGTKRTSAVVSMPPGTLRTVELVPRQSSLNVNDRH